ncbi:MAG: SurA N-terminal domain-containing protein [Candidatus Binataceae bacterium]
MLQAFRKNAYGWTIRVLLVALIGIFCFWGIGTGFFNTVHPVASVDGRKILSAQIDQEVTRIQNNVRNAYGDRAQTMLQGINLRELALQQLIQQALVDREAQRLGIRVSDGDLARAIESQTAFQEDGRFNVRRYNAILRSNDLDAAGFETQTRDQMVVDAIRQMVSNSVQVSSEEAHTEFNRINQRLSMAYVVFPYSNFTTAIHPTDKELVDFYEKNKQGFRQPERIQIIFVRYDPLALAGSSTPADAEIQDYYRQHLKDEFTHPEQVRARHILIAVPEDATPRQKAAARAKAEELLKKARSGADFAKLAKDYSQDPGTRNNGGELGFFSRGQMIKPFENAAFGLKPGQFDIAQTQYGYHVIEVEAVKPAHLETLAEARPRIIEDIRRKSGSEVARQDLDLDLAAALEGHPLNELAKKRGLVAVETPFFAANDQIKGAEDDPKLVKEVFKMNPGDVHAVTDGAVPYIVKMVARKPAHVPPYKDITGLVRTAYINLQAESRAHTAAGTMLKLIKDPADFGAVAAQNQMRVQTTPEFTRSDRAIPGIGPFPEAAVAAGLVPKVPGIIPHVMDNQGSAFILEVLTRAAPDGDIWKANEKSFTAQLLQERQISAWGDFINELKDRAQIQIDANQLGATSNPAPM